MTTPVAHNYARALVELMKEQGLLDITRETADTLSSYFKNSEIISFLKHPKVSKDEKKVLLQKLISTETPQEFLNFLNLIVDRARQNLLPEIMERIVRLTIVEQGYEIVTLVVAQPMPEEEKKTIINKLEDSWQVKIYPLFRINPNLLGGIVIQRGDKLYDGSLIGRLEKIREVLTSV